MSLLENVTTPRESSRRIKMMLYGHPGSGKTVFAAGAPSPLLVAVEEGSSSLLNHEWTQDCAVLPARDPNVVLQLISEMRTKPEDYAAYETIIIDTFSELQAKILSEGVRQAYASDPTRNPYLPEGRDYQANTEQMRRIAIGLTDLDKNIIFISHEVDKEDKSTGVTITRPQLSPKLATTVKGLVDIQCYLTLRKTREEGLKRQLQIHPGGSIETKTRLGGLPPVLDNPTFADILAAKESISTGENNE